MRDLPLVLVVPSDAALAVSRVQDSAGLEGAQRPAWSRRAGLTSALALVATDILALVLAVGLTLVLRYLIWGPLPYPLGLVEMGAGWIVLRLATGLYPGFGLSPVEVLQKSVTTTTVAALAHTTLLFGLKAAGASRFVVLLTWALLALASWSLRGVCKGILIRLRRFGAPVIVIGAGESGSHLVGELRRNPGLGLIPVAFFDNDPAKQGRTVAGVPVLGPVEEALRTRFPSPVHHALIAIPSLGGQRLARLARSLSVRYLTLGIMRDMFGLADLSLRPRALGACLALEVRNNLLDPVNMAVKRAFDLLVAAPLALVTLPVVVAVGLAVKLVSPGPAFFVQEREGLGGRRIRVWKIRTMVRNAEGLLEQFLAENEDARAEWARHMKLRNDPRVIPVLGHILRRFSLDELPQLWNVLKGELTLVGPRPFPHYHLAQFSEAFLELRRQAPPGMTGLWQVTTRSEGDLQEQEQTDSFYIRNWSLWMDLWVMMRTAKAVLGADGERTDQRARDGSRGDAMRIATQPPERHTVLGRVARAMEKPHRILPYLSRFARNWLLRLTSHTFVDYYARIVDTVAATDPNLSVGSASYADWESIGKLQFSYLRKHGLQPYHRLLDVGCGNLRAGRYFIEYLEQGNYVGIDISPVVLLSALKVVKDYGLADKTPYIYLVRDADYRFLPGSYFDVVHAHSVFTHLPLTVIGAVMAGVKSILKPGGFFDFTFFSSATQGSFLGEDFFYPEDVLLELAARLGFEAQIMTDWTYPQEKVRASLPRA